MGIFNKVKERVRKMCLETPGKHLGNTQETPGIKGAGLEKKNFSSNTCGDFEPRKREK